MMVYTTVTVHGVGWINVLTGKEDINDIKSSHDFQDNNLNNCLQIWYKTYPLFRWLRGSCATSKEY